MDAADRSRAAVEDYIRELEAEFGSLSVSQTTFEVGAGHYQRAVEQSSAGRLDVHALVEDEDGAVLLHEGDGEWVLPRGQTRPEESPGDAAERVVSEAVGADCTVTDAVKATISGVRNGDDASAETVYRLAVVFTVELIESPDAPGEAVRWDADRDPVSEVV
ncbi:NUDIX hydrolase [Haloarcula litorea]|uniref:NUDIX hydrolase n=1 Tax=Haloarcula litorea TaxID=3032579 RepID=UPI0023E7F8BE|nr:NUDIX domain-containing protein [Halomicroarcula sp. GDY20]